MALLAGGAFATLFVLAALHMPAFGGRHHLYRDHAVAASVEHRTANVVSSINFDQRGLDTLGEESVLLASVSGVVVLLRKADDETESEGLARGEVLSSTRLAGYAMLPVTALLGFDVITHGSLTPGGGFQGGVVLGTGLHVVYLAGRYQALQRARPLPVFEWGEALGAGAFACLGLATVLAGSSFLANVVPKGTFGELLSSGTVPLLNGAVGIEVASATVVLLAKFLEQALLVHQGPTDGRGEAPKEGHAK